MATKVFSKALMASEDVQSYNGSCKFYDGTADEIGAYAEIHDGAFVNIEGLDLDGTYGVNSLDYNVHQAVAPAADKLTREDICVIDLASIEEWIKGKDAIKFGNRLTDLTVEAGMAVRFRRLMKGDKFWLGEGNFTAAPTVGEYATVAAAATTLTPNAAITADQMNVAIRASKHMTIGQAVAAKQPSGWEQLYLVEVL